MNLQETFQYFLEAKKRLQKKTKHPQYEMSKKFIQALNKQLLLTKQSPNREKKIISYLNSYKKKIDKLNESIRTAKTQGRNTLNMRWRLQLYKKAYNDFKLLKNIQFKGKK